MEKIVANSKKNGADSEIIAAVYSSALDLLDNYLDLVDLPPLDSGHYDKDFDTLVGETARLI